MKVVVVGAGVMGPGIAQTFLMGGHEATLVDISQEALEKGTKEVKKCLELMEEMEIIEGGDEMFTRLGISTSMDVAADADLVVEAVPEKPDIKQSVYEQLDPLCKPDTVFVSNTSSFPISDLFPDFRPGNLFVCHFFNPPAINPLIELVHNEDTNVEKVQWVREILEGCGKKPIVVKDYVLGFLMNRIQTAMSREALYLMEQDIVSADDLNTAIKVGLGFKTAWQGIFDTLDVIGLDTVAFAQGLLSHDLYDGTEVPKVITDKVAEGKLGLKTGEGFYKYEDVEAVQEKRFMELIDQLRLYKKYGI